MAIAGDYVLIRRPAIPRVWDPIARPHVAIVVDDPDSEISFRVYLSNVIEKEGQKILETTDLDSLPEDTLLEVRHSAQMANLYRLELVDGVVCWRWVGRCRGLDDFEQPSVINWDGILESQYIELSMAS
jgi:hypothetical protein